MTPEEARWPDTLRDHGMKWVECPECGATDTDRQGEIPAALTRERDAVHALLREVEWAASDNNDDAICPVCRGNRDARLDYGTVLPHGHEPDCRLAAALRA